MQHPFKYLLIVIALAILGIGLAAFAQAPLQPQSLDPSAGSAWRPSGSSMASAAPATGDLQPVAGGPRASIAKVTSGTGTLPNDGGQVWREYDITPYTLRVTSTNRPEQAIVDWILRETGYEAWHSEPLGILSANGRTLRVYHTPQMQEQVSEIVDRFVNTQAETQSFGLRVMTIGSPAWRTKAQRVLRPVSVQSQGVQAWLLSKEDAALLTAELAKRTDFREHSSPHLLVQNGQSTVIAATRPHNYLKDVILKSEVMPGFQPEMGQIAEGFTVEFKPLISLDGRSIDAVVKCNIDEVEKLVPVMIDVPTPISPKQRTEIQVPQIDSCRFAEKFHWPLDMVLVIGFGITPSPTPTEPTAVKVPLVSQGTHADLLVIIENKGPISPPKPAAITRSVSPTVMPR